MSDFDDLFKNRLDEEASFPNRNKNWKQLSKRLEAFETGKTQVGKGHLRFWQLATGLSIAVAVLLVWKYQETTQENQTLRKERDLLQQEVLKQSPIAAAATENAKTPVVKNTTNSEDTHQASAIAANPSPSSETFALPKKQALQPAVLSDKHLSTANEPKPTPGATPFKDLSSNSATQDPKGVTDKETANTSTVSNAEHQKTGTGTAEEKAAENPIAQAQEPAQQGQDSQLPPQAVGKDTLAASVAKTEMPLAPVDSTAVAEKADTTQEVVAQAPASAPANKEIKPHHEHKMRFRAGIQGSVGWVQPKQKGVSALSGQGISFEARVLPGLWATTSVDWMQHEINTEEFVPKFHPHHDSLPQPPHQSNPGGPQQHPDKLVQVQSNPREQHYSLGLRYTLPLHFWVKPTVMVSHEWVHISPNLVTYQFEEDDPGMPQHHDEEKYTAEKFPAQWLSKQWHLGAGLEKEVSSWTFSAWAEYSKSFASTTPSYDALYLRLKAQYMF